MKKFKVAIDRIKENDVIATSCLDQNSHLIIHSINGSKASITMYIWDEGTLYKTSSMNTTLANYFDFRGTPEENVMYVFDSSKPGSDSVDYYKKCTSVDHSNFKNAISMDE